MKRAMRHALAVLALLACASAPAGATVPVLFGTTWDDPPVPLQRIVDALYGPGKINVTTDYIGAHPGDPDPWFWVASEFKALMIREVNSVAANDVLGWYVENGTKPVVDGVDDGIVFSGAPTAGQTSWVAFSGPTKFGFYLGPNAGLAATGTQQPVTYFTNRMYNDPGPQGTGAIHVPYGGDMQALVFDVSAIVGPNTWLVCFEDHDSGANPGAAGSAQTDNDYNDLVFEVTALGATPAHTVSFGAIKAKYAR